MNRTAVATAGVLALALTVVVASAAFAQDGEPATAVTNPNTQEVSDTLVPQADAYTVYAEHIRALNACDWVAIMAQYPDTAEIHLSGGHGREGPSGHR